MCHPIQTADVPRGSQKTLMQKRLSTAVSLQHESYQLVWMWISAPEANSCGVLSHWRKPEGLPGRPLWVCLWQGELPLEAVGLQFQRLNLQEADSECVNENIMENGWTPLLGTTTDLFLKPPPASELDPTPDE